LNAFGGFVIDLEKDRPADSDTICPVQKKLNPCPFEASLWSPLEEVRRAIDRQGLATSDTQLQRPEGRLSVEHKRFRY
jgi:hypothetical protein